MKKILLGLTSILGLVSVAEAEPISITAFDTAFTQNFDSLANTGTANTVPSDATTSSGTAASGLQGFQFIENSGAPNAGTYSTTTGTANTGDSYSFGVAGTNAVTDRAFGQLNSGSFGNGQVANAATPTTAFGFLFTNNTGGTINGLTISYRGEQYRFGGATTGGPDQLDFQINTAATPIAGSGFTNVDSLDFISPVNSGTARALDGNAAGNFTNVNGVFNPTDGIANGSTFAIRFVPVDRTSSDDGLAIDDFSLTASVTAVPEPTTIAMLLMGLGGVAGSRLKKKRKDADSSADALEPLAA